MDTVRTLARHLVHHERVGFKRVSAQRKSELAGDGTWRDDLLMDLLAEDLE